MIENEEETVVNTVLDLEMKLEGIDCLLETVQEPKGKVALEIFNDLIENLYILLWENSVVNLSWLFEKTGDVKGGRDNKKHVRSLYWYIEEQKRKCPDKADEADAQIARLDNLKIVLAKIRRVRNKWLCHRDEEACKDPSKFLREVSLNLDDMRLLVETGAEIIRNYIPVRRLEQFGIHKLFWAVEYPEHFVEGVEKVERDLGVEYRT